MNVSRLLLHQHVVGRLHTQVGLVRAQNLLVAVKFLLGQRLLWLESPCELFLVHASLLLANSFLRVEHMMLIVTDLIFTTIEEHLWGAPIVETKMPVLEYYLRFLILHLHLVRIVNR